MTAVQQAKKLVISKDESDDELQSELKLLCDRVLEKDSKLLQSALDMLKHMICTSTSSMTAVPKPLKYLAPYYDVLRNRCNSMESGPLKWSLCNIVSFLSMAPGCNKGELDCLEYCLMGTIDNIGDWGHEYVSQLEVDLTKQWVISEDYDHLKPLLDQIIRFDFAHHAEIQACDLLMEINQLGMLFQCTTKENYKAICRYLVACAKYIDVIESLKIRKIASTIYFDFGEFCEAAILAMSNDDETLICNIFLSCEDSLIVKQIAFLVACQLYPAMIETEDDELKTILDNAHLSQYFINFARELDVLEPKSPEDVYKIRLEPTNMRNRVLSEKLDSAKQNLASSFVNGFINAGFGTDKLLTIENGNRWIYRNKDRGMLSATASLGLLYLWDVDGGLTPIDKYLYATDNKVKGGALLALGIINCRIRNDCDPALALLSDYLTSSSEELQIGAIFGIGLAYAGTARLDVLDLLLRVVQCSKQVEIFGIASLACGLVALGRKYCELTDIIMTRMIESKDSEDLKSPHMLLAALGVGLAYFRKPEDIEAPIVIAEVLEEPFKSTVQTLLQMCAYAGTGDVLLIQELLRLIEERIETPSASSLSTKEKNKYEWDLDMGKAVATLGVSVIALGEDIGVEMNERIFGQISRYGEPTVRKAVPLAVALSNVSNPESRAMNILSKYSHDVDDDVACNAIFGLGIIGAGSNSARLDVILRQLAMYHARNLAQLFMVRIAQGLVHLGKGTMTLDPIHTNRQLLNPVAMAGLLIPLVALLKPTNLILGRSHYLLFSLAATIYPRWLLTLDENLESLSVTVRVGEAVDTVAKAGTPKTITGIHTHNTPVLLSSHEKAELANGDYETVAPLFDGICILKKV